MFAMEQQGGGGFFFQNDYFYAEEGTNSVKARRLVMAEKRFAEEPAALWEPRIDKLLTMMGAARDAFNRHSRTSLQELQSLAGGLPQDFAAISTHLKSLTALT